MNESEIKDKILKAFGKSNRSNKIFLVVTPPEHYNLCKYTLLKYLLNEKNMKGIYVALNRAYSEILSASKGELIKTDNLRFIDCSGERSKQIPKSNVLFVESPSALTEISIQITAQTNKEKIDFLFFDSLNTMSMYHNPVIIERFMHFIFNKLRQKEVAASIM